MKWYYELLIIALSTLMLSILVKYLWDSGYNLEWIANTITKAFARIMDYMVTKYIP